MAFANPSAMSPEKQRHSDPHKAEAMKKGRRGSFP